jgi:hypothetical protein
MTISRLSRVSLGGFRQSAGWGGYCRSVPGTKEKILPTRANEAHSAEAKARAEASFKKEERAKEGAKAMTEYVASGKAVRERMAELKALRLAKEAKEAKEAKAVVDKPRAKVNARAP